MAISSFSYITQDLDEYQNQSIIFSKLGADFNKHLEPLQKIYKARGSLDEKLVSVQPLATYVNLYYLQTV